MLILVQRTERFDAELEVEDKEEEEAKRKRSNCEPEFCSNRVRMLEILAEVRRMVLEVRCKKDWKEGACYSEQSTEILGATKQSLKKL